MRYLFLIGFCCFFTLPVTAQDYEWQWSERGGGWVGLSSDTPTYHREYEKVNSVVVDGDNNYYFLADVGKYNTTFGDIEFQTYGLVNAEPGEDEQHFHWEHKDGEKALTIAFDPATSKFLGINTFGIRMRHEIFDRWLTEERDLEFILKNFREANFDPEFYDRHEKEIFSSFKQYV